MKKNNRNGAALFAVLFIFMLVQTGCRAQQYQVRPVLSIDSVEVVSQNSHKAELKVVATVPDPCYQYDRAEFSSDGSLLRATLLVKRPREVNCVQVLGRITVILTVPLSAPHIQAIRLQGASPARAKTIRLDRSQKE